MFFFLPSQYLIQHSSVIFKQDVSHLEEYGKSPVAITVGNKVDFHDDSTLQKLSEEEKSPIIGNKEEKGFLGFTVM
jgi:hypothetical protein